MNKIQSYNYPWFAEYFTNQLIRVCVWNSPEEKNNLHSLADPGKLKKLHIIRK